MHLTLECDYAIRTVDRLSTAADRISAANISEDTAVTLRFTLKILRKLMAAGIVKSHKGATGGYSLAKPASDISLGDIIRAIEGPYRLNRCLANDHVCTRNKGGYCYYHEVFKEISEIVQQKLDAAKIVDARRK